jgi:hypothetical protein
MSFLLHNIFDWQLIVVYAKIDLFKSDTNRLFESLNLLNIFSGILFKRKYDETYS